jgi:RNA polymerase sigma-70 factor (ECF subfamily)
MNRAIAVGELDGPAAALDLLEGLDLPNYHLYHAARGEFLGRLGRRSEAVIAYEQAEALTANQTERRLLHDRARQLAGPVTAESYRFSEDPELSR